jgi:hypothetical protein
VTGVTGQSPNPASVVAAVTKVLAKFEERHLSELTPPEQPPVVVRKRAPVEIDGSVDGYGDSAGVRDIETAGESGSVRRKPEPSPPPPNATTEDFPAGGKVSSAANAQNSAPPPSGRNHINGLLDGGAQNSAPQPSLATLPHRGTRSLYDNPGQLAGPVPVHDMIEVNVPDPVWLDHPIRAAGEVNRGLPCDTVSSVSPRLVPIERCSGSQHAHADDDKDCREDRPQHLVRHPRTQMAAEEDARQRAND